MSAQLSLGGAGCAGCSMGWLDMAPGDLCPSCDTPLVDSWSAYSSFLQNQHQIPVAGFDSCGSIARIENRNPRNGYVARFVRFVARCVKRVCRGRR